MQNDPNPTNPRQPHEMILLARYLTGEETWYCPDCQRLVISGPSIAEGTRVLDPGDRSAHEPQAQPDAGELQYVWLDWARESPALAAFLSGLVQS